MWSAVGRGRRTWSTTLNRHFHIFNKWSLNKARDETELEGSHQGRSRRCWALGCWCCLLLRLWESPETRSHLGTTEEACEPRPGCWRQQVNNWWRKRSKPGSSSSANATMCIPSMSSSWNQNIVYNFRLWLTETLQHLGWLAQPNWLAHPCFKHILCTKLPQRCPAKRISCAASTRLCERALWH